MNRVMLVVPPNTMKEDSGRRIGEPLGVLYLAAVLEKDGQPLSYWLFAEQLRGG